MKMASAQEKAFCHWVGEDEFSYSRYSCAMGVFLFSDYVKDSVFVQQLPTDIPELKRKITEVVASVTGDILIIFWEERDYRFDACLVTRGAVCKVFKKLGEILYHCMCLT
jgi:hypothetical protein